MAPLPDSAVAILWLAATALLGAAGWETAARLFPEDAVLTKLGHAIVLGWAHIVLMGILLGATGLLWPVALLTGVASLAALTLGLVIWRVPTHAAAVYDRTDPQPTGTPASQLAQWLWAAVWGTLFAFWLGHVVTAGLLRFPDDFDTLMYHLPLVDHWLQAGSLYAPDGLRWSDPGNNELITLWLVAPFSGDFLYALTNLPASLLLACAAVEFGRRIGLSMSFQNLAGLAVVTHFVVFKQLIDTENDVAAAALFLACLAYALRYAEWGRIADLIFGVACLGLLAGVKYYALGYASIAATAAGLLIARRRGGRVATRAAILGLLGVLTFGGYWYVRNWAAGGSPLHPLGLTADGDGLGAVYQGSVWSTTFLGSGRPELPELAIKAVWGMTGPCHLATILVLPVTITWLVVSGFRQAQRPRRSVECAARSVLAFVTVASGLVLLVTPFAVEDVPGTLNQMHWMYCPVRYGMCFLSLAVLALVVLLHDISRGFRTWSEQVRGRSYYLVLSLAHAPQVLLAVGVLFQFKGLWRLELADGFVNGLLLATNILLAGAIVGLVVNNWPQRRVLLTVILGWALASGASWAVDSLAQRWHSGFGSNYDRMLAGGLFRYQAETQPVGSCVCVLDLRSYPFFGSARQFRVCQPQQVHSRQELEDYLRVRDVALFAARFDTNWTARGWQNSRAWLVDNNRLFVPIHEGSWPYTVYRIAFTE